MKTLQLGTPFSSSPTSRLSLLQRVSAAALAFSTVLSTTPSYAAAGLLSANEDRSGWFQNTDGSVPATPGSPLGLAIDTSKMGGKTWDQWKNAHQTVGEYMDGFQSVDDFLNAQTNIVTDPTFATGATNWALTVTDASASVQFGEGYADVIASSARARISTELTFVVGNVYEAEVRFEIQEGTPAGQIKVGEAQGGAAVISEQFNSEGTARVRFIATDTTHWLTFQTEGVGTIRFSAPKVRLYPSDEQIKSMQLVRGFTDRAGVGTDLRDLPEWLNYGTPVSVTVLENNAFTIVQDGSNEGVVLQAGVEDGVLYRLQYTYTGDGSPDIFASGGTQAVGQPTGVTDFYFVADASGLIYFRVNTNSAGTGTFSNLSLTRVPDHTDLETGSTDLTGLGVTGQSGSPATAPEYDPTTGIGLAARTDSSNTGGVRLPVGEGAWFAIDIECPADSPRSVQVRSDYAGAIYKSVAAGERHWVIGQLSPGDTDVFVSMGTDGQTATFQIHNLIRLPSAPWVAPDDASRPTVYDEFDQTTAALTDNGQLGDSLTRLSDVILNLGSTAAVQEDGSYIFTSTTGSFNRAEYRPTVEFGEWYDVSITARSLSGTPRSYAWIGFLDDQGANPDIVFTSEYTTHTVRVRAFSGSGVPAIRLYTSPNGGGAATDQFQLSSITVRKVLTVFDERGPELLSNPDFSAGLSDSWTFDNGAIGTLSDDRIRIENGIAGAGRLKQTIVTEIGATYELNVALLDSAISGNVRVSVDEASDTFNGDLLAVNPTKSETYTFVATTTNTYVNFYVNSSTLGAWVELATPLSLKKVTYPNVVSNSDFSSTNDWTLGTGWGISGGVASNDGSNTALTQALTGLTLGAWYRVRYRVINSVASGFKHNSGSVIEPENVYRSTDGWYTEYGRATATSGDLAFWGGGGVEVDQITVHEVPASIAREYFFTMLGSELAQNLPEATNLITKTEDHTHGDWGGQSVTVTLSDQKGPLSGVNVHLVTLDASPASTAGHTYNLDIVNGNTYTQSIYVKKGNSRWVQLWFGSTGFSGGYANFDLDNGVLGSYDVNLVDQGIENVGGGWYRIWITNDTTADGTAAVIAVVPVTDDNANRFGEALGSGTVYVAAPQAEVSTEPTDYQAINEAFMDDMVFVIGYRGNDDQGMLLATDDNNVYYGAWQSGSSSAVVNTVPSGGDADNVKFRVNGNYVYPSIRGELEDEVRRPDADEWRVLLVTGADLRGRSHVQVGRYGTASSVWDLDGDIAFIGLFENQAGLGRALEVEAADALSITLPDQVYAVSNPDFQDLTKLFKDDGSNPAVGEEFQVAFDESGTFLNWARKQAADNTLADATIQISDAFSSDGVWDAATSTMSNTTPTTGSNSYPRLRLQNIGVTEDEYYYVRVQVSDDTHINSIRIGGGGGTPLTNVSEGVYEGVGIASGNSELQLLVDGSAGALSFVVEDVKVVSLNDKMWTGNARLLDAFDQTTAALLDAGTRGSQLVTDTAIANAIALTGQLITEPTIPNQVSSGVQLIANQPFPSEVSQGPQLNSDLTEGNTRVYGPELVDNGTWSVAGNAVDQGDGVLDLGSSITGIPAFISGTVAEEGQLYEITYTVNSIVTSGGGVSPRFGDTLLTTRFAVGTYTEIIRAEGSGRLEYLKRGVTDFNGVVSGTSVRKVFTAYDELGSELKQGVYTGTFQGAGAVDEGNDTWVIERNTGINNWVRLNLDDGWYEIDLSFEVLGGAGTWSIWDGNGQTGDTGNGGRHVFRVNLTTFWRLQFNNPGNEGRVTINSIKPLAYPNLVSNGTFDADSDWTKGTGWTIGSGVATHATGAGSALDQSISVNGSAWHRIVIDATASGGTFALEFRGGTTVAISSGLGSGDQQVFYARTDAGTNTLRIYAGSGTTLEIDNVSVQEVPYFREFEVIAGQEYEVSFTVASAEGTLELNIPELQISETGLSAGVHTFKGRATADGTARATFYETSADSTEEWSVTGWSIREVLTAYDALGLELSTDDWDATQGTVVTTANSVDPDPASGSGTQIVQLLNPGLVAGRTYEFMFDITGRTVGNCYPRLGGYTNLETINTQAGSHRYVLTPDAGSFADVVQFVFNSGFDGTVENISIREMLVPNLVTNGTFDADTDWTKENGPTISGGVGTFNGGASERLRQDVVEAGKWYRVLVYVSSYTSGTGGVQIGSTIVSDLEAVGWYSYYVRSDGTLFGIRGNGGVFSVDSVIVQEVPYFRDVEVTAGQEYDVTFTLTADNPVDLYIEELGIAETNIAAGTHTFSGRAISTGTARAYILESSADPSEVWSISGFSIREVLTAFDQYGSELMGVASAPVVQRLTYNGTAVQITDPGSLSAYQDLEAGRFETGATYEIVTTVVSVAAAGDIRMRAGSTQGAVVNYSQAQQVHTERVVATSDLGLWIETIGSHTFEGALNVSVKKVIAPNLLTNPGFDTDSDWTKGGTISIANGEASWNDEATAALISQNVSFETGKVYRVLVHVSSYTSGDLFIRQPFTSGDTDNGSLVGGVADTEGWHVFYGTAQGLTRLDLRVDGSGGNSLSIDYVSVQEVPNSRTVEVEAGQLYDVSFTLTADDGPVDFDLPALGISETGLTAGTHSFRGRAPESGTFPAIFFQTSGDAGEGFSVASFSIQEVETVFEGRGPELGSLTPADWESTGQGQSGAAEALNGLEVTGGAAVGQGATLAFSCTIGKTYRVNWAVELGTASIVDFSVTEDGNSAAVANRDGSDAYEYINGAENGTWEFVATAETQLVRLSPRVDGLTAILTQLDISEVEVPNLITNGTFDADEDWTKGTGWTIANGVASCDGSAPGTTNLSQFGKLTIDTWYRVRFYLASYTAGNVRAFAGGTVNTGNKTEIGWHEEYLRSDGSGFTIQGTTGFIGSVDNVSVEEIPNYEEIEVEAGKEYELSFDLTTTTGSIQLRAEDLNISEDALTTGTHTFKGRANVTGTIRVTFLETSRDPTEEWSFENLSARKVDTAFDELGSEIVQNGQFLTDLENWVEVASTGFITQSDGRAVWALGGSYLSQQSPVGVIAGDTYEITFDATVTSGTLRIGIGATGDVATITESGNYKFVLKANGDLATYGIWFHGQGGEFAGSIDNVSVKEVLYPQLMSDQTGDWVTGTGWSVDGASASFSGTATADAYQDIDIADYEWLLVRFYVSEVSNGSIYVIDPIVTTGSHALGNINTVGWHEGYIRVDPTRQKRLTYRFIPTDASGSTCTITKTIVQSVPASIARMYYADFDGAEQQLLWGIPFGADRDGLSVTIAVRSDDTNGLLVTSPGEAFLGRFLDGGGATINSDFGNGVVSYQNGALWEPTTRDEVYDLLSNAGYDIITYTGLSNTDLNQLALAWFAQSNAANTALELPFVSVYSDSETTRLAEERKAQTLVRIVDPSFSLAA